MNLSKNFTLAEMTKSQTAARLGINNIPDINQKANLFRLCDYCLQPIREEFGALRVSSGFRSVELCESLGSNKHSFHAQGQAADIECYRDVSNIDLLIWIYENLDFTELIAEFFDEDDTKSGWVHVALAKGRENEKMLKLKDKNHNYKIVTIDYLKELYKS